MAYVTRVESSEEKYIMTINKIRGTIRRLEASLKYSRELEAVRSLRYSTLKSRDNILMSDLKKAKIRDKQMLNLFRQSVTDIQLDSVDILPETLKRRVQRTWHQKYSLVLFLSFSFFIHGLVNFYMIHCGSRYDALLSQNKQLRKQIVATDCTLKEKQKEINTLQQRLLNIAGNIVTSEENAVKICRKCWILTTAT